ncbi:CHRD domain-containing protein [Paenibacillus lautus]
MRTIRDLIREFERGNAYVNVRTIQNPNGEIRGQFGGRLF